MKLSTMVIDLKGGIVHCSAERINENGVIASVVFTIPESQLISEALADGRYTWDNQDVLRNGSLMYGAPIS